MVDERHRDGDRDPGQHAGDQQPDEIDVGIRERVDDHADRRRNDRPQDRSRRGQRRRVLGLVAVVPHHPDHDRAGPRRVGERRAGDAGEEGERQDVGVAHAAAKPADELRGEAQQDFGKRAARHQLGGEDEERHGLQREHVDAGEDRTSAARAAAGCRRRASRPASRRPARTRPERRARAAASRR